MATSLLPYLLRVRGVSQSRRTHDPECAGAEPAPAILETDAAQLFCTRGNSCEQSFTTAINLLYPCLTMTDQI